MLTVQLVRVRVLPMNASHANAFELNEEIMRKSMVGKGEGGKWQIWLEIERIDKVIHKRIPFPYTYMPPY